MSPSHPADAAGPRDPAEIIGLAARDLIAIDRPDLAEPLARLAVTTDPAHGSCHSVLAGALEALGRFADALPHWRAAARLMPDVPQQRLNLALALLGAGQWAEGFECYEARMNRDGWVPLAARPSIVAHRDRLLRPGEAVAGRHVVVFTEQGLGDSILFARYIPLLAERGARVTLVCSPPLRPLLARLGGVTTLMAPPPAQPHGKINLAAISFDAMTPLMSLPRVFATSPDSVPSPGVYLPADQARVAAWRRRLGDPADPRPRIGLAYAANPESGSARARSIPLAALRPLLDRDDVTWVNLQGGPAGRQLAAAADIRDPLATGLPLDAFADALAATDLLITCDTMAAHCAGAMAHPTWIAVPRVPMWYWGQAGTTTPWHPNARLFRQDTRGDWGDVIATIGAALDDFVRQYAGRFDRTAQSD